MKFFTLIITSLLAGLLTITNANAEQGIINASAMHELPEGKSIQVRALDDSDENLLLKAEIEKQLIKKGYTVSNTASLVLDFETREQAGDWNSGPGSHVFSFEAQGGRGGGENHSARVSVFDSDTGGLLNRGQGDRAATATPSQFRMDITIEDRAQGKTYWQAWSIAELGIGDRGSLAKRMIPPLIEGIGKTIRSKSF